MPEMQCPKCEGTMEQGFLLDRFSLRLDGVPTFWVAGRYERGYSWSWTRNIGKRRKHSITAYRCTKCGYLELYAQD